jgi:PhnB protein
MASVAIYLNFAGDTEEAFELYKKAFGTEYATPPMRFKDMPPREGAPQLPEEELNKVTHVALPILGGILIMGSDMLESMGHKLVAGNNLTINLSPDTREEADRLFSILSEGGKDAVAPHDEFWGYWGTCQDRFGTRWMFNIVKQWNQ